VLAAESRIIHISDIGGVYIHGAEFDHVKRLTLQSPTLCKVEHRSAIAKPDPRGDDKNKQA
jgi:hypothetical protein